MGPRTRRFKGRELGCLAVIEQQFEDDQRLARRYKRRFIANRNFKLNSSCEDGFNKLNKAVERICVDDDDEEEEEEVGDYSKFLRGVASSLPGYIDIANGCYDPGYVDNCCVDAINVNRVVKSGIGADAGDVIVESDSIAGNVAVDLGNAKARSVDGDVVHGCNIPRSSINGNNENFELSLSKVVGNEVVHAVNEAYTRPPVDANDGNESDDNDVEELWYKMFLAGLRMDGNSYVVSLNSLTTSCVSRITDDGQFPITNLRYGSDDDVPSSDELREDKRKSEKRLRHVPSRNRKSSTVKRNMKNVSLDPISSKSNRQASKRWRREILSPNKHDYRCQKNVVVVDPDPKFHMNFFKGDNQNAFLDDEWNSFGADEQSSSDEEVVELDIDQHFSGKHNPFVTKRYEILNEENEGSFQICGNSKNYSKFKEELGEIFKKPYDENECNELLAEAKLRRPVQRDKNLRGRIKSCPTGTVGKSYLDLHDDLARKIEAAKNDRPKVLNLLRGFFYWLQNIAREGEIFRPWREDSIL